MTKEDTSGLPEKIRFTSSGMIVEYEMLVYKDENGQYIGESTYKLPLVGEISYAPRPLKVDHMLRMLSKYEHTVLED